MRRAAWALAFVLAGSSAAFAQAGYGTGGSTSGNQAGGVSDSHSPSDAGGRGFQQGTGGAPYAGSDEKGLQNLVHNPVEADRTRDHLSIPGAVDSSQRDQGGQRHY